MRKLFGFVLIIIVIGVLVYLISSPGHVTNTKTTNSNPARDQPKNEVQTACGVAAMTDYTKANLALLQQGTPLMSVEATIAQRRLEELYCLRSVRCILDDVSSLQFMAAFDSCLQDEALEKYNAHQ
jgi:hypothetical protein